MKTLSLLVLLALSSLAMAKPSGNMAKTTRYFGPNGHVGTARTYDYGKTQRSYYYDSKGKYQGQKVKQK